MQAEEGRRFESRREMPAEQQGDDNIPKTTTTKQRAQISAQLPEDVLPHTQAYWPENQALASLCQEAKQTISCGFQFLDKWTSVTLRPPISSILYMQCLFYFVFVFVCLFVS